MNEELIVFKRKKIDITKDLKKMNFYEFPNYDYLLNLPIHTFTEEKILSLEKEHSEKDSEYSKIQSTTVKDLWGHDLNKI